MQSVIAENIVFRPASPGDKGENVRLIQEKLITLGYLQSGASGNYLDQYTNKNHNINTSFCRKEYVCKAISFFI